MSEVQYGALWDVLLHLWLFVIEVREVFMKFLCSSIVWGGSV